MHGREEKHQQFGEHAKNTTPKKTLQQIVRHEYVTQVWFKKQNPYHDTYCKTKFNTKFNTEKFCNCGFPKDLLIEECKICSSDVIKSIKKALRVEKSVQVCTNIFKK